jgi:hypothetical protein
MKPQNSAERTKAFIRFLILYIATTALIITAVFFGIYVPFKQNKQLQDQLNVVQKEKDFDRQFFTLMQDTKSLLDTVNSAGSSIDVIEGRIAQKIQEMDAILSKDSISGKRIYSQVVQYFTDAKNDKKTLRSSDKQKIIADCEQLNAELKRKLEENKTQYDKLYYQYLSLQK